MVKRWCESVGGKHLKKKNIVYTKRGWKGTDGDKNRTEFGEGKEGKNRVQGSVQI